MRDSGVRTIGVWDDHDFGVNNGGSDFSRKALYREMYLDILDEAKDSARRLESD